MNAINLSLKYDTHNHSISEWDGKTERRRPESCRRRSHRDRRDYDERRYDSRKAKHPNLTLYGWMRSITRARLGVDRRQQGDQREPTFSSQTILYVNQGRDCLPAQLTVTNQSLTQYTSTFLVSHNLHQHDTLLLVKSCRLKAQYSQSQKKNSPSYCSQCSHPDDNYLPDN